MSTTVTKTQAAQATDAKPKPTIAAVPTLNNPLAKGLSFGRVAALLGLLVYRFDALVAEPVSTLKTAVPVVAVVQLAYALLCLPAAGSAPSKKARPGEKKKPEVAGSNPVVTALVSLVLAAIATPAVHVLFVLFGAPFLTHLPHTFLCAAHFSLLGLLPIFYSRGLDSQALVAVAGASAPLDETFGGLLGAVLGAWLGAVPIPLDWDREWQKWPVTILAGMYAGSCLGSWISGALFYGKRLNVASAPTKEE